ncbi:MAG: 3-hydroxyacyl-CoA dehydrogenase family protein [Anaerolineae bacterium]
MTTNSLGIKKVGVVGCGLMGSGIAETCARAGYEVIVREVNQDLLDKGLANIRKSVGRAVERGKLAPDEAERLLGRIEGVTDMEALAPCNLVIEAAIEKMEVKKEIFAHLDGILAPQAIIASNTSSLCITEMASVTQRPGQVLGMHFFNPVPVMPLLELVRTILTRDEALATARAFGESLGKTCIVAKDTPGFIVNLLLVPYLMDAVRALENGVATREDIDAAMKLGCNHPMGPLTLLDFIGLDTCYYIANVMFEEFKDPRYAAPPLLRRMVLAGHLGRKSGKGFYDYK